jgi:hypothetical protein
MVTKSSTARRADPVRIAAGKDVFCIVAHGVKTSNIVGNNASKIIGVNIKIIVGAVVLRSCLVDIVNKTFINLFANYFFLIIHEFNYIFM